MRWWRRFDAGNSTAPGEAPAEARRRGSERVGGVLRVAVRCASWPDLANLFTGNLSEDGLFVRSHEPPAVAEHVQLDLALPSGATLALTGRVVNVVTPADAAARGVAAGMGIKLDPMVGEARTAFDKLLANARSYRPRPAEPLSAAPAEPPRPPPIAPTDVVRHSTMMRAIRDADLEGEGVSIGEPVPPMAPPAPRRVRRAPTTGVPIGIDLAIGHTTVAALVGTKIGVLEDARGERHIPSVVSVGDDGGLIAGAAAVPLLIERPDRTVAGPKRMLGGRLDEPELAAYLACRPLTARAMADGSAAIEVDERAYSGVEMCAALLAEARALAQGSLGLPVGEAVVSVPLRWTEERIDALRRAGELAGLEIVAVIDEPSAAAMANRFDPRFAGFIGVFDLGGHSCDFTVLNAARADLRVLATAGDATLGSDHIDEVVARAVAEQFRRRHQLDLAQASGAWPRLLAACEQAKRELSARPSANVVVPSIARGLDLSLRLDQGLIARACESLMRRALRQCDRALELADLEASQLTAIYLSGGGTHIPAVRDALTGHLGQPPRPGVAPELAIAVGAAMHGARLYFEGRPLP